MNNTLFVLFCIFLVSSCNTSVGEETTFTDFVQGFLSGLGETHGVKELTRCLKERDDLLAQIKDALEHIMTLKDDDVLVGLKTLLEASREMLKMLQPCSTAFELLKKLGDNIAKADLQALRKKVLSQGGQFFHLCIDALEGYEAKDFVAAGIAVGTIEKMLFLSELGEDTPMFGFVKGMLAGLNEKKDAKDLLKCITENEALFTSYKEGLENIKAMKDGELQKGTKTLLDNGQAILKMVQACSEGYSSLKRLSSEIARADVTKLAKKMLQSMGRYFHLAIDGLEGFLAKNFVAAGTAVGSIYYYWFFQSRTVSPFVDFIKGFFKGINEKVDIEKLMECLKGGEEIMEKVMKAMEFIMKMDIINVWKGIQMLIEVVKEISTKLQPCASTYEELKKLLNAIAHANILDIALKIIKNPSPYLHDVLDFVEMMRSGYYENAGKDLGDILFRLFLSK